MLQLKRRFDDKPSSYYNKLILSIKDKKYRAKVIVNTPIEMREKWYWNGIFRRD